MAKVQLPQEFIDKFNDPNITWFIKDGSIEYDTVIVTETVVLQSEVEDTDISIGIKHDINTYVYQPLKNIVYNNDNTFSVVIGDVKLRHFKLLPLDNIKDNVTKSVNIPNLNKIVHLAKGMKGSKGDTGKSAYDIFVASPDNTKYTEDQFRDGLRKALELQDDLKILRKTIDDQNILLTKAITAIRKLETNVPVGSIMYSHNCPDIDYWLPFGGDVLVYADKDYPELAAIIRSWNNPGFIVDDEHFRLSDANDKNRYLFAASSAKPSGMFVESQLPNIKGYSSYICASGNGGTGAINIRHVGGSLKAGGSWGAGQIHFDASKHSSVYKDDVTQVHPDSIGLNSWIKAKRLEITI